MNWSPPQLLSNDLYFAERKKFLRLPKWTDHFYIYLVKPAAYVAVDVGSVESEREACQEEPHEPGAQFHTQFSCHSRSFLRKYALESEERNQHQQSPRRLLAVEPRPEHVDLERK